MSFETQFQNEALKQYVHRGVRKRYFVSEGDLFMLYKEVMLIRSKEDRERCMANFRKLLSEAQPVELTLKKKGGSDGNT